MSKCRINHSHKIIRIDAEGNSFIFTSEDCESCIAFSELHKYLAPPLIDIIIKGYFEENRIIRCFDHLYWCFSYDMWTHKTNPSILMTCKRVEIYRNSYYYIPEDLFDQYYRIVCEFICSLNPRASRNSLWGVVHRRIKLLVRRYVSKG